LIRLHQRAGELLKSEIDYAAAVVKAFVHELEHPTEALSAAWQRAFRARAAFEAASGATRVDSRELRRWLRSYRTALNAVTSACTSLESALSSAPSTSLTPEFVAAVDDYVDALRGAPPSAATPWTVDIDELTAATQQVRERGAGLAADNAAARVLVAEVAAITRSLAGIASARKPTSAG
ncbi:MAG TPA: FUSC family protein, partial [Mycobacterium sp.]|nr:FUSC family protein [Mycobacterium sp.]